MNTGKMIRVLVLFIILTAGVWLLGRPGNLQPEGPTRLQALNSLSLNDADDDGVAAQDDASTGQSVVLDPVSPVEVNFADVRISTEDPDSMYNRWLRGELDLDESESIVGKAEMARMVQEALVQEVDEGVQQARSGGPAAPAPGVSFDAIDYTDSGGSVPPDPELAVGPNHMIAVVNVAVAIYDKTGTVLVGPTAASNFFSAITACQSGLYDPNVLYDEEEDRWILAYDKGAFDPNGGYCLAASQTSDPTGAWYLYFFQVNTASVWLDFPHAGVGDNHIFMGGNMFTMGGSFSEGRIFAFDKSDLYAGAAVSAVQRGLGGSGSTPQPLNLHGYSSGTWPSHGDSHYFLTDPYNGQTYNLEQWNPVIDSLTTVGNPDLGPASQPIDVPQDGVGLVQANDWRPLDFEYRNGYGWTTMTVSCNPGGGAVNCIRWAQIDLTNANIGPAGLGTYGSSGQYRFFPDLAVNDCSDMAVGYTRSSSSSYPSIWVTGRENTDPNGTLQAEAQLKAGEIAYTAFDSSPRRWGDYTGMTIDPDGQTFWYLGEYSKITGNPNGRWGTYIGAFGYPGCGGPPTDPQIVVDPAMLQGTQDVDSVVTRTLTISNTGGLDLDWTIDEALDTAPQTGSAATSPATAANADSNSGQVADPGATLTSIVEQSLPRPAVEPYTPLPLAPRNPVDSHLVIYGDRAAFDLDNPGLPVEDFEEGNVASGATLACPAPVDQTSNDVCFSPGDILPGIQFANDPGPDTDGLVLIGDGFNGNPSIALLANTFVDTFVISLTTPVNAVGMDLHSHFSASTVDITIYEADRTTVMTTTTASATNTGAFWGINAQDPIGLITIHSQTDQAEGVDNIAFGDVELTGCAAPQDVPWLSVAPQSGTTAPNAASPADVIFDATGLSPGVYTATLCVNSNDPATPRVEVPVEMTVEDWKIYLPFILKP